MTTIWLGVTRHGPLAPEACQLGKYDIFTRTGWPTRSTSKEIRSSFCTMLVTLTGVTGSRGGSTAAPSTRGHSFGPLTARGTSHRPGSVYQDTAAFSQGLPPLA